jgi:hypothetical protein
MSDEQKLYLKLDVVKNTIPQNEWKYYHISSIENFIFHLKNIKNERSKDRTANNIEKYIDAATQKLDDHSDLATKSKELFVLVWKLSDLYRYELGFIKKPDYLIISIIVVILFFLLRLSFSTVQSFIVSIIGFAGYALYGYLKIKARKVY